MTNAATGYDADAAARGRTEANYMVGGRVYHPVKKSGRVVREILAMTAPEDVDPEKMTSAEWSAWQHKQNIEGINVLYRQVARLLQDEEGRQPIACEADLPEEQQGQGIETLEDALDVEDARAMIAKLMPNPNAGPDGGNATAP